MIAASSASHVVAACLFGAGAALLCVRRVRERILATTLRQRREMSLPTAQLSERWALVGIAVMFGVLAVLFLVS